MKRIILMMIAALMLIPCVSASAAALSDIQMVQSELLKQIQAAELSEPANTDKEFIDKTIDFEGVDLDGNIVKSAEELLVCIRKKACCRSCFFRGENDFTSAVLRSCLDEYAQRLFICVKASVVFIECYDDELLCLCTGKYQ